MYLNSFFLFIFMNTQYKQKYRQYKDIYLKLKDFSGLSEELNIKLEDKDYKINYDPSSKELRNELFFAIPLIHYLGLEKVEHRTFNDKFMTKQLLTNDKVEKRLKNIYILDYANLYYKKDFFSRFIDFIFKFDFTSNLLIIVEKVVKLSLFSNVYETMIELSLNTKINNNKRKKIEKVITKIQNHLSINLFIRTLVVTPMIETNDLIKYNPDHDWKENSFDDLIFWIYCCAFNSYLNMTKRKNPDYKSGYIFPVTYDSQNLKASNCKIISEWAFGKPEILIKRTSLYTIFDTKYQNNKFIQQPIFSNMLENKLIQILQNQLNINCLKDCNCITIYNNIYNFFNKKIIPTRNIDIFYIQIRAIQLVQYMKLLKKELFNFKENYIENGISINIKNNWVNII